MDSNPHKKDSIPFKDISSTSKKEKKSDSNLICNDSNPWISRCEEHMKNLNPHKKYLNPIYKMKLLAKDQAQGFEFSTYGFESPFLQMHLMLS